MKLTTQVTACALMVMCASTVICGCAGRMNTDLLQARIRQQAAQLSETQREIDKTRSELKQSRLEAAQLKSELTQSGHTDEPALSTETQITKVQIFPMATGGLNKDDSKGDDAIVVQFAPMDRDNKPLKQPGDVELVLLDPQLPDSEREIGRWTFNADECRSHWTRGIMGSGFQFTLPLEVPPSHAELVINLRFNTAEGHPLDTTHIVKVAITPGRAVVQGRRLLKKPIRIAEVDDAPLPPVGQSEQDDSNEELPGWAKDERKKPSVKPVLHSANWTDATIPSYR